MSGSSVASAGKSLLPASKLAIDMVNKRADILPGYRLQLIWNDTQCDPGHATNALFESLYNRPPMIMLLGAACSSVTRATAQIGKLWNFLQVSYASTASDLSNKEKYPLLFNMVPPDSAHNNARMAFLKYFKWNRIATIRQNDYVFDEAMDIFQENLINNDFELIATELFNNDPKTQVEKLKKNDARIIVGMFYEDKARKVFCEAYKQGMYGKHYMWLLIDWYDNKKWWLVKDDEVDCTEEQMRKATEGYFSIESARIVSNKLPTVSGMTSEEFLQTHVSQNNSDLYVPFVFDSVWTIALTLNNSMQQIKTTMNKSLADFTYKDSSMVQILKRTLEKLEFQGITGTIKFSDTGERTRPACIKQMQGGKPVVVGIYFPDSDKIEFSGAKVLWQGGSPPTDGKVTVYEVQYVSTPLFCVIVILASAGIILALFFLRFNIVRRKHSFIKLSSPNLNNLIILGCVLIYVSVYMVAIDGKHVGTSSLAGLCMARGYLLSIGYSLAVGGMFSKMWRVYQIFNNVKPKRKVFKYKELLGVMVILVFVDILVMSLWIGVDTPEIITTDLQSQVRDEPHLRIIPQHQHCSSAYYTTWLYILLGYKALLLLIGCFIAWVTRKAKVHSLNDSRFVCMSIYNIVLCVIVGIPLAFLIDGHADALVACLSFFLLLPTTVTLCLLFVPKIIKLKNNVEERMRLHNLSAMRGTTDSTRESNNGSIKSTQSVSDPNVVTRLQEEIASLKHEIRAIKFKHGESNTPDLTVRIADPVDNGREGKSFTQPTPKPSPRPQLGKRSVTYHTYQEMCVRKRRRRRSSSFSGPYLQRRSLDLGALFSELADPLLVLKAENKDLHRKLQEARISEAGKLAKVLHENAQLNRKIVELNIQNAPSDEAEKVSRLLKENSELKRQLGEVSILNSAWCDVTPRLHRKQNEDRKISKDLRELQQLLSVDLGARRPGSFGPSSLSRPPPIGRSQSSSDLQQWGRNGSGLVEKKKSPISPLAKDKVKRFSFDGVGKRQGLCTRDSKAGIALMVTDADKASRPESPQSEANESEPAISPGTIRRDNIDGCESEKEAFDIGERTNAGFSGDEDEGMCDIKSGEPIFTFNPSSNGLKTTKKTINEMSDSTNNVVASTNVCSSPDAKEQTESDINNATIDPNCNLTSLIAKSAHEALGITNYPQNGDLIGNDVPNGTSARKPHGVGEHLEVKVDQHIRDPTISDHNEAPGVDTPTSTSAKPDSPIFVTKLDYVLESTREGIQTPLKHSVLDHNDNLPSSDRIESKLPANNSEINFPLIEIKTTASQDEGRMSSLEASTHDSVLHDASVVAKEPVANGESAKDVPVYKKKLQKKKDKKKNDRIEKTFFV
ncbi:hypothetical protein ACROYT_G019659 [Oculina patagonica]